MELKKYEYFYNSVNEEKEDDSADHYHDNNYEQLLKEMKDFKLKKSKLDNLIKTYDYSDNMNKKLEKILESNRLLVKYWTILKKQKRVEDLKNKVETVENEIKDIKKEDPKSEDIKTKQEKVEEILEDIKNIEKENYNLEKEFKSFEKEIKVKIDDLKKKLV